MSRIAAPCLIALLAGCASPPWEADNQAMDADTGTPHDPGPGPQVTETGDPAGEETGGDTGDDTDTGGPVDTGDPGDTGTPPDTGASPEPAHYDWVVSTLEVAPRDEGFDLDGDGDTENAAWILAAVLDPLLGSLLTETGVVYVVQLADLEDFADDEEAAFALLVATDPDGDPTDNTSGSEAFDAGPLVDANGRAKASTPVEVSEGAYETVLLGDAAALIEGATPIHVAGEADPGAHRGRIGFGVPVEALVAIAPAYEDLITATADLDLDGDGVGDAFSMALAFEAVSCALIPG